MLTHQIGSLAQHMRAILVQSQETLFEMLQKGCEESDLVKKLLEEYDVEREVAEADVKKFIGKVKDAGILE